MSAPAERSCDRCGSKSAADATECVECGAVLSTDTNDVRARTFTVAIVMLELGTMFAVASFVGPRMASFSAGSHTGWMGLIFNPWWFRTWMALVAILGAVAVLGVRNRIALAVVLTLCLLAGLVPIVGSTIGIYAAAFEAAGDSGIP